MRENKNKQLKNYNMKTKNFNTIMSLDIKTQVVSTGIGGAICMIGLTAFALLTDKNPGIAAIAVLVFILVISAMIGRFICRLIVQNWTQADKQSVLEDCILFNSRRNIRLLVKAGADLKKVERWYSNKYAKEKTKKLLAELA